MLRIKILLVDDQAANLLALRSMLEHPDLELIQAHSGEEALRWLLKEEFALVLLDVQMPRLDGFETAALIRTRERCAHIPIIFVTAVNTNETHVSRGYRLGAVDYIFKPVIPEILRAKVHAFVELFRKQNALKASEERYRILFASVDQAILAVEEATGRLLDVNEAALKLYGYGREEILLLRRDALRAPGRPGGAVEGELHAAAGFERRKDGAVFPAELTEVLARLESGPVRIIVVRDITERLHAAEVERLRERDRIQREFVANVSHELRTPIAAIKGFSETLRRGAIEDRKHRMRFVKTIEAHADRLGSLVEDLLTLSAIESGRDTPKPEPIPLAPFVSDFVNGMAPLAARRKLEMAVDVPDAKVHADPKHLSQVLQNLLENAIKYNRPGGRVEVLGRPEPSHIRLAVHDTGIGIAADDLPNLFTRFHRTRRARDLAIQGTGLGLHIVKNIVEANGGRIWAESEPEKGSTFYFTVPLAR
ncbi:MAG: response regulator [Elusimicrobia bacterium]|nr:response regulator [Elusimicrobiota bacterium]